MMPGRVFHPDNSTNIGDSVPASFNVSEPAVPVPPAEPTAPTPPPPITSPPAFSTDPAPTPASPAPPVMPTPPFSPIDPADPVVPKPTPPLQQPELPRGGGLKKVLGMVAVAAVAAAIAGAGVYFWQNQKLAGSDKTKAADAATISSLNGQIASLNEQLTASKAKETVAATDEEQIKAVLDADCESVVGLKSYSVTAIKIKENFATAKHDCTPNTAKSHIVYTSTLKKVDKIWVVVYEGHSQPIPSSSIKTKYGIPASLYQ